MLIYRSVVVLLCSVVIQSVVSQVQNVIVVGGGMAGIAAARTLSNDKLNRYRVQIFEAKRDRYGGRVWTKRNLSANSKDIQADLGASFINSKVKDNPLETLAEKFEIDVETEGQSQFFTSHNQKLHKGIDLVEAKRAAEELVLKAVSTAQLNRDDISVREAIQREISNQELREDSLLVQIIQSLPSYDCIPDSSSILYGPDRLDFGYDKFVKFGLVELIDRLVAGFEAEAPLDVNLRQVVRQIEVVKEENRVIVRSGGSQTSTDAVIIAVPLAVIKNESLLFDPKLPQGFYRLFNKLNIVQSERLVLEFDEMFWPEDIGTLTMTPESSEDQGLFQSWTNLYPMTDKPYLATKVGHSVVEKFLKMTDEQVTEIALKRLKKIFGEDVVRHRNVTNILRSDWIKSLHIGGATIYPPIGSTEDMWDVFSEPLCPGLYFAGDYTVLDGLGTLHGAYTSGVRAAESLMSGYCEKKAAEEEAERKRKEEEELRKKENKTKNESDNENVGEKSSESKIPDDKDEL